MFDRGIINYGQPVNWSSPLNSGLVSWHLALRNWMGGATFSDLCGRYHGTLNGMDPTTDWVAGIRPGGFGSIELGGSPEYVQATFSITTPFTVMEWVKLSSAGSTFYGVSLNDPTSSNSQFELGGTNGSFYRFALRSAGSFFTAGNIASTTDWVHLCGVAESTTARHLYVNGVFNDTSTVSLATPTISTLDMGRLGDSTPSYGAAIRLDDVRVFDRALSASDIYAIYLDSLESYPQTLSRIRMPMLGSAAGGGSGPVYDPITGRLLNDPLFGGAVAA